MRSVVLQINAIKAMTAPEAASLAGAVAESAFTAEQKRAVATAVSERFAALDQQRRGKDPITQTLVTPWAYLTKSDWDFIEDKGNHDLHAVTCVMNRLRLLNVHALSEDSFAHLSALLAAVRNPGASRADLFTTVLDLKNAASGTRRENGDHLWVFPHVASELPSALYDQAYREEAPAPRTLPNVRLLEQRCPRRRSNKHVRAMSQPAAAPPVHQSLTDLVSANAAPGVDPLVGALAQALGQILSSSSSAREQANPIPGDLLHFPGQQRRVDTRAGSRESSPRAESIHDHPRGRADSSPHDETPQDKRRSASRESQRAASPYRSDPSESPPLCRSMSESSVVSVRKAGVHRTRYNEHVLTCSIFVASVLYCTHRHLTRVSCLWASRASLTAISSASTWLAVRK